MALPLSLRNRLADVILSALHDAGARESLRALVAACDDPRPTGTPDPAGERRPLDLLEPGPAGPRLRAHVRPHAEEFAARARRGWQVVGTRPLRAGPATLGAVLDEAAALFDAGLYFEVHEHLEPLWARAAGGERLILQGLIQVAVGLQHLANGNAPGARQLLAEGADKLRRRALNGLDLEPFARAVAACHDAVAGLGDDAPCRFDWGAVPPFPRRG